MENNSKEKRLGMKKGGRGWKKTEVDKIKQDKGKIDLKLMVRMLRGETQEGKD